MEPKEEEKITENSMKLPKMARWGGRRAPTTREYEKQTAKAVVEGRWSQGGTFSNEKGNEGTGNESAAAVQGAQKILWSTNREGTMVLWASCSTQTHSSMALGKQLKNRLQFEHRRSEFHYSTCSNILVCCCVGHRLCCVEQTTLAAVLTRLRTFW